MSRNSEKVGKWKDTVGAGILRENWPKRKMRNSHAWNMARNNEKREKWEMYTVGPGIGQKTDKWGKWETHMVGH